MSETRQIRLKRKADDDEPTGIRQILTFGLILLILFVGFVFAVRYVVAKRQSLNSSIDTQSEGLYLKLSMKKTSFTPGEPIDLDLLARNLTEKEIKLEFDTDIEFDLVVQAEMDILVAQVPQNIWQYSSDTSHLPKAKPHSVIIPPGQEMGFRARWNQRNFKGQQVKAGRYIITGFLLAKNRNERLQLRGETK